MEEIDINSDYASVKFIPKQSWQEYLIDLLGGLVPGILFLVGNSFILFPSLYALNISLREKDKGETFLVYTENILRSTQNTPSAVWIVTFLVIFFLAYTVGLLFFRRDPNEPDRKSFRQLMKRHVLNNPKCTGFERLMIRLNLKHGLNDETAEKEEKVELRGEYASDDPKKCQFPYSYYDEYLDKRGFEYLIPLVVWNDNLADNEKKKISENKNEHEKKKENKNERRKDIRSKCWINLYKTRLMYYHADKCGTIIRNEAHVRMASSTWYVSKFLTWFGLLGFILSISAVFLARFYSNQFSEFMQAVSWYAIALVMPFMVAAFSSYFYWRILKFLHYQRLREILVVLDTYYVAYRRNPELMELPIKDFKTNMKSTFIKLGIPVSAKRLFSHKKK